MAFETNRICFGMCPVPQALLLANVHVSGEFRTWIVAPGPESPHAPNRARVQLAEDDSWAK
jgi:hypothetical protein